MTYRILVIAPSWIGDCVMTQPLLARLKQRQDHTIIDVYAANWSKAVFSRMPEVNSIITNPFGHGDVKLRARFREGRALAKGQYQEVVVLPGSLKSALVPFFSGIKRRTGFLGESRRGLLNNIHELDEMALPLMVERYAKLAQTPTEALQRPVAYPRLQVNDAQQQQTLQDLQLSTKEAVVFCPGAEYGPAKRWPAEHYADLAQRFLQEGKQIWLIGSQKDHDIAEQINQLSLNQCINLCGKTKIDQAIDLIATAKVVVCNDSGLMHVAAAVGTPVVSVFGSSSPHHTPPLSQKAKIVSLNLDCSPCFERVCPLGHTNCLNQLTPLSVYLAAQELMTSL